MLVKIFMYCILVINLLIHPYFINFDETVKMEKYTELIGQSEASVYELLSISSHSIIESREPGVITLLEKEVILDHSFDVSLLFDVNNDQLYGYRYRAIFTYNLESIAKLIKKLYKLIVEKYGEPDTHPYQPDRITGVSDLESVLSDKSSVALIELWELERPESFGLEFSVIKKESTIIIELSYKLMPRLFPRSKNYID